MASLAELEEVVKFYGPVQALGPITTSIPKGAVGLLGPNGSGKTTLLRLLMGVIPPTAGRIRVMGLDVGPRNVREFQQRIGYAPEGDAHFPGLTGVEAVAYAGRLVGMRKDDAMERAHQVIDYVQLGEARYRLVDKYSTGMRQRLKLAQALVHDPELLILDEPTEGVDPQVRLQILDLIEQLVDDHGINALVSTHQLHDVERLTDYVVVLQDGVPVAEGKLEDLKRAPKKSFLVRVNGPVEPLVEHLRAEGVPYDHEAPNVRIEVEDPREVLRLVRAAGLMIRHLQPTELSLGEAFTSAVGGGQHR